MLQVPVEERMELAKFQKLWTCLRLRRRPSRCLGLYRAWAKVLHVAVELCTSWAKARAVALAAAKPANAWTLETTLEAEPSNCRCCPLCQLSLDWLARLVPRTKLLAYRQKQILRGEVAVQLEPRLIAGKRQMLAPVKVAWDKILEVELLLARCSHYR